MGDPLIGSVVGGHRITRLLGRGGMGVVYHAVDLSLDRAVAVKLIRPELVELPGFRERFIAESTVAASIDHPNVLPVFARGEHEGALFLAMRYVVGRDLASVIAQEGGLAPQRAAAIVAQVGAALSAAHARKLVHRDVKPSNVLLTNDEHAYLTDFGLVKDLGVSAGDTHPGAVVGTLDYIAPETLRGDPVGPWSDVYALGCLAFVALTGRAVFPLDTPEQKLWAHMRDPPPALAALCPDAPPQLDDVVGRALAKDPSERYDSAAAFGAALVDAAARVPGPGAGGELPAAVARVLAAARASERGIRAAADRAPSAYAEVTREAADFMVAMEDVARRVGLLSEALKRVAPGLLERRLTEIRAGQVPGKPARLAALARQVQVRHRMEARLEVSVGEMKRILAELEVVRGEVLAAPTGADQVVAERRLAGDLRVLRHELDEVADGMETVIAAGKDLC